MDWKVLVDEYGHYGVCQLIMYGKSFWPFCEVIDYGEDVSVAWTGSFTLCDQVHGNLAEGGILEFVSFVEGKLELSLFSMAKCTLGDAFPDIFVHAFPIIWHVIKQ